MSTTLKEILLALVSLPIFKNAGFYFALWGLVITFAPRFGIQFTQAEIGQVTVFISLLFGISPPTIQYMQMKLYEARVKAEQANSLRGGPPTASASQPQDIHS